MSSKSRIFIELRRALPFCILAAAGAGAVALTVTDLGLFLHKVWDRILENLAWVVQLPANHAERFFLPYLLLSFGLALLIVGRESPEPLGWRQRLARIFPRAVYWHRSARVDYAVFLTDRIFTPAMLVTRLFSTALLAGWIATELNALLGPREPLLSGIPALITFTLLFALSADLADYLQHRMHHASKLLWQFHRLHHSAEVLTPLTAFRVHPVEQSLGALMTTVMVGAVTGVSSHWLMESPQPITFLGTQLFALILYTLGAVHLRHTHIWMSWSPFLSHVLISPAQHQIHHSVAPRHWNRNYGNVLALWDWMFGSLYVPLAREQLTFGLAEGQPHPTVTSAYLEPLHRAWAVLKTRFRLRRLSAPPPLTAPEITATSQ